MKVKQAQRIVSAIGDEILFYTDKLNPYGTFSSVSASISTTEITLSEAINSIEELNSTKFELRSLIKGFNTEKVDSKTCKMAELESMLESLTQVANKSYPRESRGYGQNKEYTSGVTSDFQLEYRNKIKKVNREIQKLKDSCNGINSQGEISVPDKTMLVLKKYALID